MRPFPFDAVLVTAAVLAPSYAPAGEPAWDPKAAAAYLDARADWWLGWSGAARGHGTACLSCHTAVPIALARPALAGIGQPAGDRRPVDGVIARVENWDRIIAAPAAEANPFVAFYPKDRKPSALGTEAVLNALVLTDTDRRGAKALSPSTRKALDHLWEQQQPNGAWRWLDFGLNPWEKDGSYYGAALAAVAVGMAGHDYADQADVRPKVAALTGFLRTNYADQPLHHRVAALWAASRIPGVLTETDTAALIDELFATQEPDGGWALAKLGKPIKQVNAWKARAMYPDGAVSDGYATGLVVLAFKRSGVSADQPNLRRAIAWLATHQANGSWPATYLNRRRNPDEPIGQFMRDAATAFAVLALTEPGRPPRVTK
jgi:hypothetical protein